MSLNLLFSLWGSRHYGAAFPAFPMTTVKIKPQFFSDNSRSVMKNKGNSYPYQTHSLVDILASDRPSHFTNDYLLFLILANKEFITYNVTNATTLPWFLDSFGDYLEQGQMLQATVRRESVPMSNVDRAAEIFSEHGEFILTVIRYHTGNNDKADDLFQDFFLSLVCKPLPPNVHNVKGYLYRAIISKIIDAARRREKYRTRLHKYAKNLNYSVNKKTPANVLIEVEETNKMFKLIERQLPNSEAQAITLRYRHNYNIKEIARKMNVKSKTITRYLSSGLSKARKFLTIKKVI